MLGTLCLSQPAVVSQGRRKTGVVVVGSAKTHSVVPNMKVFEQRGKSVGNVPLIPTYGCFTGKAENRCGCCRSSSKTQSVVPNKKVP